MCDDHDCDKDECDGWHDITEWVKPLWLVGKKYMWGELTEEQKEIVRKNSVEIENENREARGLIRNAIKRATERGNELR